jgi:hypothetical protein
MTSVNAECNSNSLSGIGDSAEVEMTPAAT